jgi:release factor glutamine methyltransferase
MTIDQSLAWAVSSLGSAVQRPRLEAELLLAHHLGQPRTYLHLYGTMELIDFDGFAALIARRAGYEPYEYIVGEVSFYDLHLYTAPEVLIARPETELLIERSAAIIASEGLTQIAEVGVGSGAISVVLARQFPKLKITATDISPKALALASRNLSRHGVAQQVSLLCCDLLCGIDCEIEMVVSNPPYIAEGCVLEPCVAAYEPREALYGGIRGDELLHRILAEVHRRGIRWLACEMGHDQRASIEAYANKLGAVVIDFYQDWAGHDRGFVVDFGFKISQGVS